MTGRWSEVIGDATVIGVDMAPINRDRRRKPTDEATLRRLAERYNEGVTVRTLAAEIGWCYTTTYSRLSMAQVSGLVVLRPRGSRVTPRAER